LEADVWNREASSHDEGARQPQISMPATGTIIAREAVDIRETGSVEGDVTSPRLAMADGAVMRAHYADSSQ